MNRSGSLCAAVMLLISTTAFSGNNMSGKLSIECGGGYAAQISSVNGEVGSALYYASGGSAIIRVNYHVKNCWGVFFQCDNQYSYFLDADYFGALNKADGQKYRYGMVNYWFDSSSQNLSNFTLGAFYRWEKDNIAVQPRIGAGIGIPSTLNINYRRILKDGSGSMEYINIHAPKLEDDDFLLESSAVYVTDNLFQLTASVQLIYKPFKHLYIFMEPGLTWSPGKVTLVKESFGSKILNDPSNWAEAVGMPSNNQTWEKDEDSKKLITFKQNFGTFISLNFGIGFTF